VVRENQGADRCNSYVISKTPSGDTEKDSSAPPEAAQTPRPAWSPSGKVRGDALLVHFIPASLQEKRKP